MNYKKRFKQENPKLWNNFEQCTKELRPVSSNDIKGKFVRIDTHIATDLGIKFPPSYMVFFMLVHLKNCEYEYQPMEKVLWEIPFKYKETDFYFTVRKFGFRLMSGTTDETLIKSVINKINNGLKIVDQMINPLLKEIVNNGDITFPNQSTFLCDRYLYFKNKVSNLILLNNKEDNKEKKVAVNFNQDMQYKKEIFYNTQAMLESYFSFQEHLLILLLPFSEFNKENDSVTKIIAADWTVKFNVIFNPSRNPDLMKYFDSLRNLKERYRNKYAHGGFEKKDGSLYAKVEGLGFIPVRQEKSNHFSLIPITELDFNEICKIIDDFDNYLFFSKKWSRPIQLIKSGLDIYFDDTHVKQYREAVISDEKLQQFIEYQAMLEDRNINMDW
ncbi:hypothetical protein [Bacillus alkalicellulosilyticus]|uniref:hypothetical protein n=1 Tax=Alkalihalobacterium alkalicellulosilyticum TaxID=1912214 RepID=UPI00099736C3|nr:hypothetical protein [Bacillus alkalicellulosilyticus]